MNKVAFVKVTLSVMLLAAFHTAKTSELEHVWTKMTLGFISQKQCCRFTKNTYASESMLSQYSYEVL